MSREPFDFYWGEGETPTLTAAVYQAVGAASVCWENMSGTGVFDDVRAREVAERLLRFIADCEDVHADS